MDGSANQDAPTPAREDARTLPDAAPTLAKAATLAREDSRALPNAADAWNKAATAAAIMLDPAAIAHALDPTGVLRACLLVSQQQQQEQLMPPTPEHTTLPQKKRHAPTDANAPPMPKKQRIGARGNAPSSGFRGVSQHKLTLRWESSLWHEKRQVYLGGWADEKEAARAYDVVALHAKGELANTNFPAADYAEELKAFEGLALEEVVVQVRRRSTAFSRGKSRYRGVSIHRSPSGGNKPVYEARIGSMGNRKNVFLGLFDTEEDAARAYDTALVEQKANQGRLPITNFSSPLPAHDAPPSPPQPPPPPPPPPPPSRDDEQQAVHALIAANALLGMAQ